MYHLGEGSMKTTAIADEIIINSPFQDYPRREDHTKQTFVYISCLAV